MQTLNREINDGADAAQAGRGEAGAGRQEPPARPAPAKATSHLLSGAGDKGTTLRAAGSKTSAHGRTCQALLRTPQRDSRAANPFYRWGDYGPKR